MLKDDGLFPSVMVCLPVSPPFHVHIVSATFSACRPLPSSTPPNNTFFLYPSEPSLPFYQPSFIQASGSRPCQRCFLENQKHSAVLCMLINKAVGFFPWDWKCHLHQTGAWNSNYILELGFHNYSSVWGREKKDKKEIIAANKLGLSVASFSQVFL